MLTDIRPRLEAAISQQGRPSSDFDLNTGVDLPDRRKLRPAGVLIAISMNRSTPHVILTKRSSALKHHPGQIAFAGGKQDDTDKDVIAAALREAREEIGLPEAAVDVVGALPSHETITGFEVTPVIGLVHEPFEIVPEAGEVAEVFAVPLAHVLNTANYLIASRRWKGAPRRYFTVPYGPYYIWGATARMLRGLADRMAHDQT
jgi:8-oxo-dGTP pyrophosphatase MutT (NUDIX family)